MGGLRKNIEALKEQGTDDNLYGSGQVSFYAKGQILGKWLLTLAYDSAKDTGSGQGITSSSNNQTTLRNYIDPNRYYLLYGDGSQQRYDAASQTKLYVKLERDQFYALFGDFETGMNSTELTRYNRVFNGFKSEYNDGRSSVAVYAADTAQNHARDEILGNGTSGLYRLSLGNIVLGSESIRLETRDRLHSENILATQQLTRDVDYTLDSIAGTLFFRQPVLAHDALFNPVFIVADYETEGNGKRQLNAGARATTLLLDGKLTVGGSYLRDGNRLGNTDLGGIDLKLRTGETSELRLEAARGSYVNTTGTLSGSGGATANGDSDTLNVYDPPVFSKSFSPDPLASGGTAVLTFTITNPSGNPGTISNFSFSDVLPTTPGAMKVAATPGLVTCGTGTLTAAANATTISYSGGSLAPGATCTLQVNVTATAGGSYTNSVSLGNTGAGAGNLANVSTGGGKVSFSTVTATASLTVMPTNPTLSVAKTVSTLSDPVNGSSNPKAIPGATMVYAVTVSNTGPGSVSTDSTIITDPIPANLTLCTGNSSGSSGLTVAFIDGAGGNASGLTPLTAADITYSSTAGGGPPFTYSPAANTCDTAITGIRINPKGSMSGAAGANTPTFTLQFKTQVR